MKTVLLGAPGSGKGTQSIILSRRYNVPQISTGDLLRKAIKSGYELNEKAKTAIDAGAFVSDDIVIGLIHKRLSNDDTKNGYIIDGFPRNIIQAKSLDLMLEKLNKNLEGVILFDIDYKELIQRLTGRRTCNNCGAIYNIHSSIPLIKDNCNHCNGKLFIRTDDNEETISNRIKIYEKQTIPLINYYNEQNKFHSIPGTGDIDEIASTVSALFDRI
ncbi:MAG: adenylate kinase [Piscirickettsiaceae bacterium]|nr:adenylate kinase [Piscirickettsiaceae bacterium]